MLTYNQTRQHDYFASLYRAQIIRIPKLLYFLSICNLALGSSAFVLGSIVSDVARDLQVSAATAGQAMTAYALATAVLAPPMLVLLARWPRRWALSTSLALVAMGGAVCALSPSITWVYIGRVLMGVGAVFTPMGAGIAVSSVAPELRGRALATAFLGMSLSYVVGIPLGAWIAAHYDWRTAILFFAAFTGLMSILCVFVIPANLKVPTASFSGAIALISRSDVLRILGLTLLYFSAIFSVFSYIGPVLNHLQQLTANELSLTLTLFGVSGVIGTITGGLASDKFGPRKTLTFQLIGMIVMMVLLPLSKGAYWPMASILFVWGICGFGMMSPQQIRLANADMQRAPLLLSLNTSMLYLGTALGAIVGGIASQKVGFENISGVTSLFVVAAFLLLITTPQKGVAAKLPG